MAEALVRNWWLVALRGLAALILGIMMFIWPAITLLVLIIFFGAYALVDGIFAVVSSFVNAKKLQHRWVLFTEGILGIIVGIVVFVWPGITAIALLFLIAFWAIVTGVLEIIFAANHWKAMHGKWLLLLAGIVSVLFGGLILMKPGAGALAVIVLIASYLVLFGGMFIALGFWLKSKGKLLTSGNP